MKRSLTRWLLRCYPRAWRRRYSVEFAALLLGRPLTPSIIFDVLLGALDAHYLERTTRGEGAMPGRGLGRAEALFWRRWVVLYAMAGLLVGLIYHLVLNILARLMPIEPDPFRLLLWQPLICGALYLALLAAAASIQWRLLRHVLPEVGRGWIAATICGTLAALAMMTSHRGYRQLPDVLSMSKFAVWNLGNPSSLTSGQLLPVVLISGYFFAIAATVQALVLQRAVVNAAWWVAISIAAALAALAIVRTLAALTGAGPYHLSRVNPAALGLDVLLTTVAYAAFGAVTGAGLLWLVGRRRAGGGPVRRGATEDLATA